MAEEVEIIEAKPIRGHIPDDESRRLARTLGGLGIPHRMIARQIGISEPTLIKHYAADLEEGSSKATTAVAKRLYDIAMGDDKKTALTAAIFWLKCRAGWKAENTEQNITQINLQNNVALGKVRTDDEIERFRARWETIGIDDLGGKA
jgi:hypothetical protein